MHFSPLSFAVSEYTGTGLTIVREVKIELPFYPHFVHVEKLHLNDGNYLIVERTIKFPGNGLFTAAKNLQVVHYLSKYVYRSVKKVWAIFSKFDEKLTLFE